MNIQLQSEVTEYIEGQVRAGRNNSADEVVAAAVYRMMRDERLGDFVPGELDKLVAEGEADIQRGDVLDGEEVFRKLREKTAMWRGRAAQPPAEPHP